MAKMKSAEASAKGLELVAHAGDARSNLIKAMHLVVDGKVEEADKLFEEAQESLTEAHKVQFDMIQLEAQGKNVEYSFIMSHGQDHLMTTYILRDMYEIFKKMAKK